MFSQKEGNVPRFACVGFLREKIRDFLIEQELSSFEFFCCFRIKYSSNFPGDFSVENMYVYILKRQKRTRRRRRRRRRNDGNASEIYFLAERSACHLKISPWKREMGSKLTPVSRRSPCGWPGWRRCSRRRIATSSDREPRNELCPCVFLPSCSRSPRPPLDTS